MASSGAWRRVGGAAAMLLSAALIAAGCTDAAAPPPQQPPTGGESGPASYPAEGVPEVVPQPQKAERLGDDVAVRGKVELVVDPFVDPQTRDLAQRVLREAGASDVVVREPGAAAEDATLLVRIGDRMAPGIVKGLQANGWGAPGSLPEEGYVFAARGGQDSVVLGADDATGAYYGVQTLRQLASPGRIAGVGVVDQPNMPLRGSIEGFYGSPWTHAERMDQLAFYGDVKLNTYIYAPKDDPYHRERWREPYPADKLDEVKQLIGQAGAHHVKFTFALSPGTSICYNDPADFQALQAKLQAVYDSGVRDFSVPFDDISYTRWNCAEDQERYGAPGEAAAGRAQAELLSRVQREFIDTHPGAQPLQTVPTEYSDYDDSAYKTALRDGLDPRVVVMWTGDGVIPEQITVSDAEKAAQVWGRKVFLWDNYPVNDFNKSVGRLLLGPYGEREPGLSEQLVGDVVNPMNQAAASKVVEVGAADFAWNDDDFDAQRAHRAAARYLATDPSAALRPASAADPETTRALLVFFDLNSMSPLANGSPWQPPAPELERRLEEFRGEWDGGDRAKALAGLRDYAQQIAQAPERIRSSAPKDFAADSEPWLQATDLWGDALVTTVDGLQARQDGNQAVADERFAAAAELGRRAEQVQTVPGETRPQGAVRLADGVLDVFVREAPQLP
ncbi:beta-N-acetylglucosaminidase domain-containing protein [Saccharopolyspora gloriosae]|uniref:Hyaluronoglucosaminidase n=1 Tax=Saccharopolyspora gloriosae TaxID=455344 RepID=A0A840NQC4_9PSEU|nr:beta-N-acetylglucosaminidase domain-containing protein [Saccharopolyspora gloriosae]MBB5072185.1 hyaluronoglucosaminidase [Saccharopolyspora gloriosae]